VTKRRRVKSVAKASNLGLAHIEQQGSRPAPPLRTDDSRANHRTWPRALIDSSAFLLTIISLLLWIPTFYPDIHIDHRGPVDPTQPFATPFAVTNDGIKAVYHVGFTCTYRSVLLADGSVKSISPSVFVLVADRLSRGETIDVSCFGIGSVNGIAVKQAQVDVLVTFSAFSFVSFDPHKQSTACEQFTTFPTALGLDWRERPEDDKQNCTVQP
jgi:hypothetical protein